MDQEHPNRRAWLKQAGALTVGGLADTAARADTFPQRSVRFIIPFTPGQGSDVIGRLMSERLGPVWKQTVIVDNRPGANGALAVSEVTKVVLSLSKAQVSRTSVVWQHMQKNVSSTSSSSL